MNQGMISILTALLTLGCMVAAPAQEPERPGSGHGSREIRGAQQPPLAVFYTDVPAHTFDIILGRPERDRVSLSILGYQSMECYVTYGANRANLARNTDVCQLAGNRPREIVLEGLTPDTEYTYQLHWRSSPTVAFLTDGPHSFRTQRSPGSQFTFTVQADSHLDCPEAPALYVETLHAVASEKPDFHIDLGDTFMTDKRRQEFKTAFPQYLAQRYYFGLVCNAAPLFLVLGNHDGESGRRFGGGSDSMPVWSNSMRKTYFPNPVPDGFYTGNDTPLEPSGLLEDYFAWTWGDALFVVLDPYWFTLSRSRDERAYWERTLGDTQYRWLETTLAQSHAAFKFVFIHNLVGGADTSMRGGAEAARLFEWGGHDLDGGDAFAEHRPGWTAPIHALLARYGVNVVFHGHDHFFARQELDGVTYQLVPQPSNPGGHDPVRMARQYGYLDGDFLSSPGYLRVSVAPAVTTVAYVRIPASESGDTRAKAPEVAFEYSLRSAASSGLNAARTYNGHGDRVSGGIAFQGEAR